MPDGARAVTGSYDRMVKLWSLSDGREIATLSGHKERINSLTVSSYDGTIASGGWDGEIRLWDGSGRSRVLANQGGPVGAMRFSNDGKWLLSTCAYTGCSFTQTVWEVATGNRRLTYTRHDNIVRPAALSPDGRLIATGGGNQRQIDLWDFASGATSKVLAGTGVQVLAAGFSTDSRWITWDSEVKTSPPGQGPSRIRWALRLPERGQALGQPGRVGKDSPSSFVYSRLTLGAYSLSHRRGGRYGYDAILDVKKDGQTLVSIERDSTNGYQHRGYTFTPDGRWPDHRLGRGQRLPDCL
jgi:WD40 repeat protein